VLNHGNFESPINNKSLFTSKGPQFTMRVCLMLCQAIRGEFSFL
jgi:hypothetical protein